MLLVAANDVCLIGGKDLGLDLVDADAPSNRFGGALIVAGNHHRADLQFFQQLDGFGTMFSDDIGNGEDGHCAIFTVDAKDRLPFGFQVGHWLGELLSGFRQIAKAADLDEAVCDRSLHAKTTLGFKGGDRGNLQISFASALDDRLADGVFALRLYGSGDGEGFFF